VGQILFLAILANKAANKSILKMLVSGLTECFFRSFSCLSFLPRTWKKTSCSTLCLHFVSPGTSIHGPRFATTSRTLHECHSSVLFGSSEVKADCTSNHTAFDSPAVPTAKLFAKQMRLLTSTSISYVLVQASERRFMRKFDVPDSGLGFRSEYAILFNPFASGYARLLNHDRLLSFSTALILQPCPMLLSSCVLPTTFDPSSICLVITPN